MSADPYKYFRSEARELLEALTRGVLDLEKGRGDSELVSRLLRQAHTLKGAARVVKQARIAELSHSTEEVLAGFREHPASASAERIRELLASIDGMSEQLTGLAEAASAQAPQAPARAPETHARASEPADEQLESVRIEIKEMDALLRTASELGVQLTGLSRQARSLDPALRLVGRLGEPAAGAGGQLERSLGESYRAISAMLERSHRYLQALQERASAMRLVQANSLFPLLERTARDAAEATGKTVVFEGSRGDVRLDAHGVGLLRNALVHIVRNAVAHGVELPHERAAAGKPPTGSVRIRVERRGDNVVFVCSDDGKGIDVDRVKQVMLARGLMTRAQAAQLTSASAATLLLRGGVTTTQGVSQIAGRGIGLDVVREAVAALNGSVAAWSEPGKGTSIELSVPVMVWSQEVLHLQAGGAVVSVALRGVRHTVRLARADIAQSPEGQSIRFGAQAVRFMPLVRLLHGPEPLGASLSALILESGTRIAALGVDRLLGIEHVTVRAMPEIVGATPLIGGAFLDSDGHPQLVLSVAGVIEAIQSAGAAAEPLSVRRSPLLVIDDSLTTRMLEEGILESAGYEVDTAASGEEALEKARQRRYGAFIVDVEMPGMDGFTFIQTARAEPELSAVPAIMVTSRDTADDRARGERVGAKAYIVKSAFDEQLLLNTVRELVG
jgi:two-component system, chemotaxis family, sensor kinase CheA